MRPHTWWVSCDATFIALSLFLFRTTIIIIILFSSYYYSYMYFFLPYREVRYFSFFFLIRHLIQNAPMFALFFVFSCFRSLFFSSQYSFLFAGIMLATLASSPRGSANQLTVMSSSQCEQLHSVTPVPYFFNLAILSRIEFTVRTGCLL